MGIKAITRNFLRWVLFTFWLWATPTTVEAVCTISSTSVAFGTYDPFNAAPLNTAGQIVYMCGNRDHNVSISLSRGSAPSFQPRLMQNGNSSLQYNLYLDPAQTIIWGDGSGGTQTYFIKNPQGNNQELSVPIYGSIPPGQNVTVGNYSDTLTLTIDF